MKAQWVQIKNKFEAFEVRERALMVGALFAAVYLAWDFILLKPIADDTKIALAHERNAKQGIGTAEAELAVLHAVSQRDPDVQLKKELQQLHEKLQSLDNELEVLAVGLVKAKDLPVMLHQMLSQTQNVRLLSLTTLPVETIDLKAEKGRSDSAGASATEDAETPSAQMAQLYKHAVQVKLEGSYSATYEFVKALEDSEWQFYWDNFDYQVAEYPNASVTLRLFTLAGDKGVFDSNLGAL